MAYELRPSQDGESLFFRLDAEAAGRCGAIGYMRADFGKTGREFWTTWFDLDARLNTHRFKTEFQEVVNSLRGDGERPPLASRKNLAAYCSATPGKELNGRGAGYMIRTQDYSYYIRCKPAAADYDIFAFAYDNRYLLPELAGRRTLPDICYSTEPGTGGVILIKKGERGYYRSEYSTDDPEYNRVLATDRNIKLGVTRAQEKAMLAGSTFGWSVPAARPQEYDLDGNPRRLTPKKKDSPER
jgi:hypothetical protein